MDSLEDAIKSLGAQRLGAICREMTKTYEETIRGTLSELLLWAKSKEILGEITIVIAGAQRVPKSFQLQALSPELKNMKRRAWIEKLQ